MALHVAPLLDPQFCAVANMECQEMALRMVGGGNGSGGHGPVMAPIAPLPVDC